MDWGKPISILLLVVLAGCAAPTPLPETTTPIPTGTSAPTETSIPLTSTSTEPATEKVTATSPVLTDGPYLVYLKNAGEQNSIVFVNEYGQAINKILLPADISRQAYWLNSLSPNGKWLAYYKGSPDTFQYPSDFPSQGPYDLSLNLLNLESGETRFVTILLSKDFPSNFQNQADNFAINGIPSELQNPNGSIALELYRSFLGGIHAKDWSPDGRYLAFAGQMNGFSSDLYVYDMETQTIRQLSSGPEEIQWISWSLDGKSILHGSTYVVGMGMSCRTYIADLVGNPVRYLSESESCGAPNKWLDDFTYLENDNQQGRYNLRSVDIYTGAIVNYWEGDFSSLAVDPVKGWIVINPFTDTYPFDPNRIFKRGLYLIDAASGTKTRLMDGMWSPEYFGIGERRFVIHTTETNGKSYFLDQNGELTPIDGDYAIISPAPDQQHWVGIGNNKISIFAADNTLIREVQFVTPQVLLETWSPDSSGFFFSYPVTSKRTWLYYLNLLSGDPVVVESDLFPVFRWITP